VSARGFIQRENIQVLGLRSDVLVEYLVRARALPGRPIPDAMIVAASVAASALPLASFDRDLVRYGIPCESRKANAYPASFLYRIRCG
jgi:hypothetical protein